MPSGWLRHGQSVGDSAAARIYRRRAPDARGDGGIMTGESGMGSGARAGKEGAHGDTEHLGEGEHQLVGSAAAAAFNIGDDIPGESVAVELEVTDQLILGPEMVMAQANDGGSDDIAIAAMADPAGRQVRRHGVGVGGANGGRRSSVVGDPSTPDPGDALFRSLRLPRTTRAGWDLSGIFQPTAKTGAAPLPRAQLRSG